MSTSQTKEILVIEVLFLKKGCVFDVETDQRYTLGSTSIHPPSVPILPSITDIDMDSELIEPVGLCLSEISEDITQPAEEGKFQSTAKLYRLLQDAVYLGLGADIAWDNQRCATDKNGMIDELTSLGPFVREEIGNAGVEVVLESEKDAILRDFRAYADTLKAPIDSGLKAMKNHVHEDQSFCHRVCVPTLWHLFYESGDGWGTDIDSYTQYIGIISEDIAVLNFNEKK